MEVKILGMGCPNCEKLEALARKAAEELGIPTTFEKVKELDKIMDYGVARTPGLVINGKVKSSGKIPSLEQIKSWMEEAE
jgi:small redox-active disulfide protein 2